MVLTPKTWYRDIETHSSQLEQLLHAALAHSLPVAPFLVVTGQAFDAFCLMHKLSALEREHTFPLKEPAKTKLIDSCKRLSLPDLLVDHLTKHYPAVLGKHEVFVWSGQNQHMLPEHSGKLVGEVSALAAVRGVWSRLIGELGVTQSQKFLHMHPLFLIAQPKQACIGELHLKDKLLAECDLTVISDTSRHTLFIDLTNGEISNNASSWEKKPATKMPLNQAALGNLARALYRKTLYKWSCPIAGTKSSLWIQPVQNHSSSIAEKTTSSAHKVVVLAKGESKGKGIAVGQVLMVKHERDWRKVHSHHIVVTNLALSKPSPISLKMRALICERVSLGPLVAVHLHELRFPVITGVAHATKLVKNGQVISVDASKGTIYAGNPFAHQKVTEVTLARVEPERLRYKTQPVKPLVRVPRIPVLDNPRQLNLSAADLREQKRVLLSWGSAIVKELGVHPNRLWLDKQSSKITGFIESSLSTLKQKCPDTILMYALSDFDLPALARLKFSPPVQKSSQHSYFGLRGAATVLVDSSDFVHVEIIALAKAHTKRIRIDVVLPFTRTPQELIALKRLLASHHLIRGGYFKVYVRFETPAQLAQVDAFLDAGIDGVVLDMHRLSLMYSGINVSLADHAPLKQNTYQALTQFINLSLVGLPLKLPVYAWYTDYDIAYASELYPKRINGFIA